MPKSKAKPKITSFKQLQLLKELVRLRRKDTARVHEHYQAFYDQHKKTAEALLKKGLVEYGYEPVEWAEPLDDQVQVGSGKGPTKPHDPQNLSWEQRKRNHDIEQDVLAEKCKWKYRVTELGMEVFDAFEYPLTLDEIKQGHTYRAKRQKVGAFGMSDDRVVLYVGAGRVQYDSDTVRDGRHYPSVPIDEFRFWAHSDVTD